MKKRYAAILLAAAITLAGCGSTESNDKISVPIYAAKAVSYNTAKAEVKEISERYFADGSYGYPYSERVRFRASGQIDQIYFTSDMNVKKGDLLCTIFSDGLDTQIEEKEVYLNQAKKTLSTLYSTAGVSYYELEDAKTEVEIQQLEYDRLVSKKDLYNVYAPCDGKFKLDRRYAGIQRYTWVNEGTALGTATDKSEQFLICKTYNKLNKVSFGTRVGLTQGVFSGEGMVADIITEDAGDYTTYTYVIRPDDDTEFMDMSGVQVSFNIYSREDVVVVPTKAIKKVGDRQFVNLLIDGVKVEQDVETGIVDGDSTEITGGLVGGEDLILN
ncbi:MAG: RND transporter [Ruminococcus sp.]|nr:RND transporter [Ruminococcus sp.]